MPKMKTKRSAAKRFIPKKNGSIKRGSAFRSHILTKKHEKRMRRLKSARVVDSTNLKSVRNMLGI